MYGNLFHIPAGLTGHSFGIEAGFWIFISAAH